MQFWLRHKVRDPVELVGLGAGQDAASEEVEVRSAVRCPVGRFDLCDGALDGAAAPAEGQSVVDGIVVFEQSGGEPAQRSDVAGLGFSDPGLEVLALALAYHPPKSLRSRMRRGRLCSDAPRSTAERMIQPVTARGFGDAIAVATGGVVPARQVCNNLRTVRALPRYPRSRSSAVSRAALVQPSCQRWAR